MNSKLDLIIPAVSGPTFAPIRDQIEQVEGLCDWVQIDVADGVFASPATWHNAADLLEVDGRTKFEIHLMVDKPELVVANWLAVADRLVVHAEATDHLAEMAEVLKSRSVELGVALNLDTPISVLDGCPESIKTIQLMGIAMIGAIGQPFDEKVIQKIKDLRIARLGAIIQVDGGVNLDTGAKCLAAGAARLVAGSAIWANADPLKALLDLQQLGNEREN